MSVQQSIGAVCTLPGGLVLEERRLGEAELRSLSGWNEEWLALHPSAPCATAVTELLGSCLVRIDDVAGSRDLVRHLLVGDRDYLMLQLRRLTLGDRISAVLACPACSTRMDVDFEVGAVPVEWRSQGDAVHAVDLDGAGEARRTVRFRLPNGADQEAVLGLNGETATDALLARCLLDDGGTALTSEEKAAVSDAMEELAPAIDLELDLVCPECGHTFVAPFDTTSFFLREMRSDSAQLMREVHWLAFYYHWSEAQILGLTRERRRLYLALLSDALRAD